METLAALIAALCLHLSAALFLPQTQGFAQASGEAGLELVSVIGPDPQMAALIKTWQQPPATSSLASIAPEAPKIPPTPPLPVLNLAANLIPSAPVLPMLDDADVAPQVSQSPAPPADPEPKVEKAPPKAKKTAPKAKAKPKAVAGAQKAKGSGGGANGGNSGGAAAATSDQSGTSAQKAEWGAAIRARIERRKTYPAAADGAKGKVVLRLRVAADGRLIKVAVAQSSGNTALDNAALSAVRSAGRFPKAPKGIAIETGFTLPMAFKP